MADNLTVDYKKLLRLTVAQRVDMARSQLGQTYLSSLTPSQYAALFPDYYKKFVPSYSSLGGGGGGAAAGTTGGGGAAGGGGAGGGGKSEAGTPYSPPTQSSVVTPPWLQKFEQEVLAKTEQSPQLSGAKAGAVDRSKFFNELKDPEVRKLFATMLQAEVGGDISESHQAFAEKVFNRATIEKKTLRTLLNDRNYFEPYQNGAFNRAKRALESNPSLVDRNLSMIDRVAREGTDRIKGATHNASGSVAEAVRGGKPHPRYKDFNSVKESILQVGKETYYYKTFEVERIKNLPRVKSDYPTGATAPATGILQQGAGETGATMPGGKPSLGPGKTDIDRAHKTVANMATGKIPLNERMLANSMSVLNRDETNDTKTLMEYFRKGGVNWDPRGKSRSWCGVFVETSLAQAGVKGAKGYQVASNWAKWGNGIEPDNVKPGDVLIELRGRRIGNTGAHVGMATGKTKVENGVQYIQMYGGNQSGAGGGQANLKWVRSSKLTVRRAPEFMDDSLSRMRATELESLGLNPLDAKSAGEQVSGQKGQEIDVTYPEEFNKLPEGLRNEITNMDPEIRNRVFSAMERAKAAGIDPIKGLSQSYEQTQQNPEVVAEAVAEAPLTGKIPDVYIPSREEMYSKFKKVPTLTDDEWDIIARTPGAVDKMVKGISDNPFSDLASPEQLASGIRDNAPQLQQFNNLPPEERKSAIKKAEERLSTPTATPTTEGKVKTTKDLKGDNAVIVDNETNKPLTTVNTQTESVQVNDDSIKIKQDTPTGTSTQTAPEAPKAAPDATAKPVSVNAMGGEVATQNNPSNITAYPITEKNRKSATYDKSNPIGMSKEYVEDASAAVTPKNARTVLADMISGKKPLNQVILDRALEMEGMSEKKDRKKITEYLKSGGKLWNTKDPKMKSLETAWCSAFVNSTLNQVGVEGSENRKNPLTATSFLEWGQEVADPTKVAPGDVLIDYTHTKTGEVLNPGERGGHVGFSTGQTRTNPKTGKLELEVLGGNQARTGGSNDGGSVNRRFYDADDFRIRRADEVIEETDEKGTMKNNDASLLPEDKKQSSKEPPKASMRQVLQERGTPNTTFVDQTYNFSKSEKTRFESNLTERKGTWANSTA